jgi:hypothetical protein
MIVGQEVAERTNSLTFFWISTNIFSFGTNKYRCIFHSLSVWKHFCSSFFSETCLRTAMDHLANFRGPPIEKHWNKRSLCLQSHSQDAKTHTGLRVVRFCFIILTIIWIFCNNCNKPPSIKFHENPFWGYLVIRKQTDVQFLLANAPKTIRLLTPAGLLFDNVWNCLM